MPKVKFIAAIDSKRGMAKGTLNMPWHLPGDLKYFKDQTANQEVLMGFNTHLALGSPLPGRKNLVLNPRASTLNAGFETVTDDKIFKRGIWVIGGAALFKELIHKADELYLTQIEKDFGCDKFFPEYKKDFRLVDSGPIISENGVEYRFEKWVKRQP